MHKYVTYILIAFAVVGVVGVGTAAINNITGRTTTGNTAAYANCPHMTGDTANYANCPHMNGVQNQNGNGNAVCPMQNANSAAGTHPCGMTNGRGMMGYGMMGRGMMGGF